MNLVSKRRCFESREDGLHDVNLGVLGACPWRALYYFDQGLIKVEQAIAINHQFGGGEIDITDFVKQDYDCKNWIELTMRREMEKDLQDDLDRPFDEFIDREREGA